MDTNKLRAWWGHKQGLDGALAGEDPAEVLYRCGWARSVGGVNPYLTLYSRAGTSRGAADRAAAELKIQELPAARGCTYVVAERDFALALRCGRDAAAAPMRVGAKLGVTEREVDALCEAILQALKDGPKDPEGLRPLLGDAARNLGAEGIKKGMTTTLPLGLGRLQSMGRIRRIPVNGRLDQQRYQYTLWDLTPLAMSDSEVYTELARRYFRWIGPAMLGEFQWFSGLGVKAAQTAIAPLKLAPLEGELLIDAGEAEAFRAFRAPKRADVRLVASIDGLIHHRRNCTSLLDSPESISAKAGGIADLPNHAIVDRGRIIGLWEFDADSGTIVWKTFQKAGAEVQQAVAATEEFVRDQLGDARSFSLDSPKGRAPRLAALRAV